MSSSIWFVTLIVALLFAVVSAGHGERVLSFSFLTRVLCAFIIVCVANALILSAGTSAFNL